MFFRRGARVEGTVDYRLILVVVWLRSRSLPYFRSSGMLRTLRTLLLQNGTGHLSLAVELELEERPPRVLEARL